MSQVNARYLDAHLGPRHCQISYPTPSCHVQQRPRGLLDNMASRANRLQRNHAQTGILESPRVFPRVSVVYQA